MVAEQVVEGAALGPLGGSDALLRRPLPPVVLEGPRRGTSARATGSPPICASGPELPAASCPEGQFCAHALGCIESTHDFFVSLKTKSMLAIVIRLSMFGYTGQHWRAQLLVPSTVFQTSSVADE